MVLKLDFDDLIHRRFLPANYKSLHMFERHSCLQTLLSNRRLCLEAFGTTNPMNAIYITSRPKSKNYRQENDAGKTDTGIGKIAGDDNTCTVDNARDKTTTKTCAMDVCLDDDVERLVDDNKSTEECLHSENIRKNEKRRMKQTKKQAEKALKQPENEDKPTVDNAQKKTPVMARDIDVNLNCDVERLADKHKKEEYLQSENMQEPGKRCTKKAKIQAEGTSKAAGKSKASRKTKLNALEYKPIATSTPTDSVTTISPLPSLDIHDMALLSEIKPTKEPEEIPINALPEDVTGPPTVSYMQATPLAKGKSIMPGTKLTFATPLIDKMSDTRPRTYPASLHQATLANFLNIQDHISRKYAPATDENGAEKPAKRSRRKNRIPLSK